MEMDCVREETTEASQFSLEEAGRLPSLPQLLRTNFPTQSNSAYLELLDELTASNHSTLVTLQQQERLTAEMFEQMKAQLRLIPTAVAPIAISPKLQCSAATDTGERRLALQLVDFLSAPLYVKRKFHISFRVINKRGESEVLDQALFCALSVLRMTPAGEEVTKTRTGKPILRGQAERGFRPHEALTFSNLVFLDISSPFPQGRFNLMIRCVNLPEIKPLLIEGVRIKARKKRPVEDF